MIIIKRMIIITTSIKTFIMKMKPAINTSEEKSAIRKSYEARSLVVQIT